MPGSNPTASPAATPRVVRPAGGTARARLRAQRQDALVANIVFSLCAGAASLAIAVLAAVKGAVVVAIVWGALAVGFAARAQYGRRRGDR